MDNINRVLDLAGLTEEACQKAKILYQMRVILISKYVNCMTREETCAFMYRDRPEYGYMSLSTYHRRLRQALNKIKNYIEL